MPYLKWFFLNEILYSTLDTSNSGEFEDEEEYNEDDEEEENEDSTECEDYGDDEGPLVRKGLM